MLLGACVVACWYGRVQAAGDWALDQGLEVYAVLGWFLLVAPVVVARFAPALLQGRQSPR